MKRIFPYICLILMACNNKSTPEPRDTIIKQPEAQEKLFRQLSSFIPSELPTNDSLSFLVLPLDFSCPSCRDKTLDSIVKFRKRILPGHYIILTLSEGGQKHIRRYFKNAGHSSVPEIPGVIFIDSTNKAGSLQLYHNNPAFYYTASGRAYRKVDAWPHTIKEDLREFFRGYRLNTE